MADEPEETDPGDSEANAEATALAELTLCENLAQTSGWAARWSASMAGADGALLWAPDTVHPLFLCIGAHGEATEKALRRSVSKDAGFVHELLSDEERQPVVLSRLDLLGASDPFLKVVPAATESCLVVPLHAEGVVVGILNLLFREPPDADETLASLAGFIDYAAPALGRALRTERKTIGMLRAIERLTNLYDLSKAFGSTIDLNELSQIIVSKAADFTVAEAASLWALEQGEVVLSATAVNENYAVEPAPPAVGSGAVADVIVERTPLLRNGLAEDDPVRTADAPYVVKSILAVPLVEEERPIGALAVTNKRGRHPEFTAADEELLQDLARQAVRALHNARLYEAEKKVEELDALLTVSREITSTLDLDKVMQTVVNASAALVTYDRCAIAVLQRGKLRLGAVSGMAEVNREDESVKRTEALLEWVYYGGADVAVTRQEDGSIVTDRPETEEKFRTFFSESGRNAFYGVLLQDEEGKLGVLGFECAEPLVFDQETRDLLQILVNQATVSVRNAQLYQQVPLAGFMKPFLEGRKKLAQIPARRTLRWGVAAAVTLVVLIVVPWQLRVEGPARVTPGRQTAVTAPLDGFVASVLHREGDTVEAGEVIATLQDDRWRKELAGAKSELEIAESNLARFRSEGNAAAMYQALARKDELQANIDLASRRLEWTKVRAPQRGVIVTPHIDEKVGQYLESGAEVCVLADTTEVVVEVAVPEPDAALLQTGQPMAVRVNPYPGRTFRGTVSRVGAVVHEEGENRFVIAESRVANADAALKPGMVGKAKVSAGRRSLAWVIFRRPVRYVWLRLWPLFS